MLKKFVRGIRLRFLLLIFFCKKRIEFCLNNHKFDDVIVVLPPKGSAWILDAIGLEIGSRIKGCNVKYIHSGDLIPGGSICIYMHYMYFYSSLCANVYNVSACKNIVYATHFEFDKFGVDVSAIYSLFKCFDHIVCMNSGLKRHLIIHGCENRKLHVNVGAADPEKFYFTDDGSERKYIGFSSAFYHRKNPSLIISIVKAMPEYEFLLLGKGWRCVDYFKDIEALSNLTYVETNYDNYPDYYRMMKVFVSTSFIEGGPIPLVEAMMAGAIPVVSNTGFANDLVENCVNGFVFNCDDDLQSIVEKIKYSFQVNKFERGLPYSCSWDSFAVCFNQIIYEEQS